MEKFFKLFTALLAVMALPPESRDEKAIGKGLKDCSDWLTSDEAKGLSNQTLVGDFRKELDTVKTAATRQAEDLAELRKLGLTSRGHGIVIPGGLDARKQMLRDGRGFMDDESAKRFGAYMADSAFKLWGMAERCPTYVREIADSVRKDMATTPGTAGGYLIPDEARPEMIRNVEAEGVVFTQARRLPLVTTGTTKMPKRTSGLTGYWVGSAAQITRSAPGFDVISLTPEKLAVLIALPNEFLRSSVLVDLGNFLATEIAYEMARSLDEAIVNGDGTATYGGIMGIMNSTTIAAVTAAVGHNTMATLTGIDISNVIGGLSNYALGESRWGMSGSVKGALRALKSTTGMPLYQRGGNGEANTIDDYPYIVTPRMPAASTIANSDKYAWFGNLRMSHIVGMIRDIEITRSEHAAFESDQTLIKGVVHVDIQEQDASAIVTAKAAA